MDNSRSEPYEDTANQDVLGNEAHDQPMEIEDDVPETQEATNDSYVTRLEERLAGKDEELSKLKDLLKQKDREILELKKQISSPHVADIDSLTHSPPPDHLSETTDIGNVGSAESYTDTTGTSKDEATDKSQRMGQSEISDLLNTKKKQTLSEKNETYETRNIDNEEIVTTNKRAMRRQNTIDKIMGIPSDSQREKEQVLCQMDRNIEKIQRETEADTKKHDAKMARLKRKKVIYEKEAEDLIRLGGFLRNNLLEQQIKTIFFENLAYFEDVWSGNVKSWRRDTFFSPGNNLDYLRRNATGGPFTDIQEDVMHSLALYKWLDTEKKRRDHWLFYTLVLLPTIYIKVYQEFFNLPSFEEAERRLLKNPKANIFFCDDNSDDENNVKRSDSDIENIQDGDDTTPEQQQLRENIEFETIEDQLLRDESVANDEVHQQAKQRKSDNSQEQITETDDFEENEGLEAKEHTYPRRSRRVTEEKLKKQEELILKEKLEIKDDRKHGLKIDQRIIDENGVDKGRGIRVRNLFSYISMKYFHFRPLEK